MNSAAGGTGHGTAYDADRHVPVVFMGRDIKPGRYAQESAPEDIAPTLAHLLRLQFPREQDSRVLLEMMPRSLRGESNRREPLLKVLSYDRVCAVKPRPSATSPSAI